MHYQAPHSHGFGGFVVLPIKPKPKPKPKLEPGHEPRAAGWLSELFAVSKAAK